jgi:thiamine kinase-like enzyme
LVLHLAEFHKAEKLVDIVQSHGDFQPANILIPTVSDQRSVYLIDWEYTEKRCRCYDAMVFELHSRYPIGLASRISQWLSDENIAYQSIKWCGLDKTESFSRYVMATFMLEDLLFRLAETTIPKLQEPNKGFLSFIDELLSVNLDTFS